jgi:hypothetical protein
MREFLPPEAFRTPNEYDRFQTDPIGYCEQILKKTPWPGREHKGQRELFEDIAASVRAQLAGEAASQVFRVEAGHGVGKTYGAAMLVNWFFDAFAPSVIMTTAPTANQVTELLWKDIKKLRPPGLPGRVLPSKPYMEKASDHWAIGRTTNDSGGTGGERFQGQHNEFFFVVLDEAEGVPDFVFKSTFAMMTGCRVAIVLMLANPRTRSSKFFKQSRVPGTSNYRLSVLDHPNVLDGRDTVPGATSRGWVFKCVWEWCQVVSTHDVDNYTFTLPFDVPAPEADVFAAYGPVGTIFLPNTEFLFRVAGIAPANLATSAFVSPGRYEAALKNEARHGEETWARVGVDVSREGDDFGTIYVRHAGVLWRHAQIAGSEVQQHTGTIYFVKLRDLALLLHKRGVRSIHFRIDGTGGFGSTAIDMLRTSSELRALFDDFQVFEVHFGSSAHDGDKYANIVTEMYAESAETLRGIRLERVPEQLEGDLTERLFTYTNKSGIAVRILEEKSIYKKRVQPRRSPDDGDGFVLCASPDFLFENAQNTVVRKNLRKGGGFA